MKLLIISRWDHHYENAGSRKLEKLAGVLLTNSFESERYHELLAQPNPAPLLAAFTLLLQVASACTPRGALLRDNGQPHDAASLAIKTRAPAAWFRRAIPYLLANHNAHEPGWLSEITVDSPAELAAHGCRFPPTSAKALAETHPLSATPLAEARHSLGGNAPPCVVFSSVRLDSLSQSESAGERDAGDDPTGVLHPPPARLPAVVAGPEAVQRQKDRALPPSLEVTAFRTARGQWIDHVVAKSGGRLSFLVLDKHDEIFARLGAALSIAAIDHSIRRNLMEPQAPRDFAAAAPRRPSAFDLVDPENEKPTERE